VLEAFDLPFVQRGLVEVLALSFGAGVLGTWIVARGLAFYAHAVGTAAFPGLVLAEGLGIAAPLGAFAAAVLFAGGVGRLSGDRRTGHDALTAIVLVGALAAGILLASDVFESGRGVDSLLFGSLLLIGWDDVALAAASSALVLLATLLVGRTWLATGFDAEATRAMGQRSGRPELLLFVLVALATTAALSAVGALLATALFIVPAATTRLWLDRMARWQIATVGLVAAEGTVGLWLSVQTNAPPGATIAVVAGAAFTLSGLARWVARRGRGRAAVTAAAALVGGGCGMSAGDSAHSGGDAVRVVASTTQIADWVRQVGGSDVEVVQMLQPNSDPHDYEPRPADVQRTASARLVFVNGGDLDAWMGDVVRDSGSDARVVDLMAGIPVKRRRGGPAGKDEPDPHWWHDSRNAVAAVEEIRDALIAVAPARRAAFEADARRYVREVRALDRLLAACLRAVPVARRKVVTDHDALAYFAGRYGLQVVGAVIPALTTQAQPSAGEVAALSRTIRRERVRAIFPEEAVNPRLAVAIARQTGATTRYRLFSDTLGPRGSRGATYLAMERANADAIVRGLTGGARGCRG